MLRQFSASSNLNAQICPAYSGGGLKGLNQMMKDSKFIWKFQNCNAHSSPLQTLKFKVRLQVVGYNDQSGQHDIDHMNHMIWSQLWSAIQVFSVWNFETNFWPKSRESQVATSNLGNEFWPQFESKTFNAQTWVMTWEFGESCDESPKRVWWWVLWWMSIEDSPMNAPKSFRSHWRGNEKRLWPPSSQQLLITS